LEPPKDLLLLLDAEVCISGIPFPIILVNEINRMIGASDLGEDPLTFSQSPTGFNGIPRIRRKPEIVLIKVIEGDGKLA